MKETPVAVAPSKFTNRAMYFQDLASGSARGLLSFEGVHLITSIVQDLAAGSESLPKVTKETQHGKINVELKDGFYHVTTETFNSDPTKKAPNLNLILSRENIERLGQLVTAIEQEHYVIPAGHVLMLR